MVGAFLGIVVLVFAVKTDTRNTYFAAYTILVIAVVGGVIAYITGESAEEAVEGISGVAGSLVEPHEESALITLISLIVLGVLAIASAAASYRNKNVQRKMGIAVLLFSALSFSFAARTAWLGGKIRHTEVSNASEETQQNRLNDSDDDQD